MTHKWTRNTSCWDCYRCHRACDGLRPCKRCVVQGRGPSCRDPAPNERIPRKRKRPQSKDSGQSSFTVKRKAVFFIVDPQHFIFPNNDPSDKRVTPPSLPVFALASYPPTSLPPPDQEFDRKNESTQSSFGEIQFREPPSAKTEERFTQHFLLDRLPSRSYLTPRRQPRRTMECNIPLSVEHFMEELRVETDEITDHYQPTAADHQMITASVFKSLSVPDDMIHLTESVFAPFGLRDSAQVCKSSPFYSWFVSFLLMYLPFNDGQPFLVFKHHLILPWLERVLQEPEDTDTFYPLDDFFLLTASPSFCDLTHYSEVLPPTNQSPIGTRN